MTTTLYFVRHHAHTSLGAAFRQATRLTIEKREPQEVHRRNFGHVDLADAFNKTPAQLQSSSELVAETSPLYLEHPADELSSAVGWFRQAQDHFDVHLIHGESSTLFLSMEHRSDAKNMVRSAGQRRAWIDGGTMIAWRCDQEVARLPDASYADKIDWVMFGELPEEVGRESCPGCNGPGVIIAEASDTGRMNVKRCDECMKFATDHAAAEALGARLYGEKDPPIWVTHSKED